MTKTILRSLSLLLLFSVLCPFLTGCWDQVEIEDRALVLGLSIDEAPPEAAKLEDKVTHLSNKGLSSRMLRITAQIAVPGRVPLGPGTGEGGGKSSPVWVVEVVGHTLDDAMNNLQQQIADPRYLVHLRVIIISEEVARKGLDELNDYLRRNPEIRRRTWLLVSEGKAAEFMDVDPPLQRVPTLYVLSMMEKAVESGKLPPDYIGTFWSADTKWGESAYLPHIALRNKDNILIDGLAYFSGGKMANKTQPVEIGVFMALRGMDPGGYSPLFPVPGIGIIMLNTKERYSKIRSSIKNGKPHLTYHVHLEADLDEHYNSDQPVNTTKRLQEIEQAFERQVQQNMLDLIRKTQKEHSDILGMGEMIRAHHQDYWSKHIHSKADWEELYSSVTVDVQLRMFVRRVGLKER